jgi:hypothetical protein
MAMMLGFFHKRKKRRNRFSRIMAPLGSDGSEWEGGLSSGHAGWKIRAPLAMRG